MNALTNLKTRNIDGLREDNVLKKVSEIRVRHFLRLKVFLTFFLSLFFLTAWQPLLSVASAASATISWNRNQEPDIAGYKIFYGTQSGRYTNSITIDDSATQPLEISYTIDGLQEGTTYYFAVKAFDLAGQESVFSDEVSKHIPSTSSNSVISSVTLDDRAFVTRQYRDFLGREPDASGLAGWRQLLENGTLSRAEVVDRILRSPEAQSSKGAIIRLYVGCSNLLPDWSGLNDWWSYFDQGLSVVDVARIFVQSSEFASTYGQLDNGTFVTELYQKILGRDPDIGGLNLWRGLLDNGALSRSEAIVYFTDSMEFKVKTSAKLYIMQLYRCMLERLPTEDELDNYTSMINGGISTVDIIDILLESQEYLDRLSSLSTSSTTQPSSVTDILDDHTFVTRQYRDFLGREPDASGLAEWRQLLENGTLSRAEVVDRILRSPEAQSSKGAIIRLYVGCSNLLPDWSGLNDWWSYFDQGLSVVDVARIFVQSSEFASTYGQLDNGTFVTELYQKILGRDPDIGGLNLWRGLLDNGALSRSEAIVYFTDSMEFKVKTSAKLYIMQLYRCMLERLPTEDELDNYTSMINGGISTVSIIDILLESQEYLDRLLSIS